MFVTLMGRITYGLIKAIHTYYNIIIVFPLRRALRRSESVKYLIPDPVIDYIKENKLYFPTK